MIKGGTVLIDLESSAVQRIIALQYNPDTINRTLQVQGVDEEGGDRSEALRLKGSPLETIKGESKIDTMDPFGITGSGHPPTESEKCCSLVLCT